MQPSSPAALLPEFLIKSRCKDLIKVGVIPQTTPVSNSWVISSFYAESTGLKSFKNVSLGKKMILFRKDHLTN